jgi:hypothetical protein
MHDRGSEDEIPDISTMDDLEIVDAHHHFFDLDRLFYPWLQERPFHDFFLGDQGLETRSGDTESLVRCTSKRSAIGRSR